MDAVRRAHYWQKTLRNYDSRYAVDKIHLTCPSLAALMRDMAQAGVLHTCLAWLMRIVHTS